MTEFEGIQILTGGTTHSFDRRIEALWVIKDANFRAGAVAMRNEAVAWARTHTIAWTSSGNRAVEQHDDADQNQLALVRSLSELPIPEPPAEAEEPKP